MENPEKAALLLAQHAVFDEPQICRSH
jgi:hypothetical protein